MLETPLFGRFQGEGRRLVFAAPVVYHGLIRGTVGAGCLMILIGLTGDNFGFSATWWLLVGTLLVLAGVAAAYSLVSISFDLKEKIYRRRQGPGLFPKQTVGSLSHLDAIVLIAEPNSRLMPGGITYHLVLHWKVRPETQGQPGEPLMVLQSDSRQLVPGQPLNISAQQLLQLGLKYSQAIGVPFYDNSHFASKCPIPIW